MYWGVPTVVPKRVGLRPLPEIGWITGSPGGDPEADSGLSSDLARPQSTTSVSPYLPSITFDGLRSR